MKTLVWLLCALLVAVWTGSVAAVLALTEWMLAAAAGVQPGAAVGEVVGGAMGTLGQWPVPAWLAPWVDVAGLEALQSVALGAVQWLGQVWPDAGSLMAWLTPLAWVVWGLVVLALVAVAALVHWLLGQAAGAAPLAAAMHRR
jgi:hypothetical protein